MFTVGQLSEFCKKTWVAGGVADRSRHQTFNFMTAQLSKQRHVSSKDNLTELFYQEFWNTKRAELKNWLINKYLMVITKDENYCLRTFEVHKKK